MARRLPTELGALSMLSLDAKLKRDRKGQWSIRINDQFRLCFEWRDGHAWRAGIVD